MWSIASRASGPARPRWLMQRVVENYNTAKWMLMTNSLRVVEEDGNKMIHHFVASCCHDKKCNVNTTFAKNEYFFTSFFNDENDGGGG